MRAYGWTTQGKLVPDEAAELRTMAQRVADGDPIKHIVADLTDRGIQTVTGRPWSHRTVTRAVQNPRVVGLRERDGALVPDPDVEAALDVETWERIRERMTSPDRQKFTPAARRAGADPADAVDLALLTGIIVCAQCGGPMYTLGDDYACGADNCGRTFIRRAMADADVVEQVLAVITSGPWLQAMNEVAETGADHYRRQLVDTDRRIVRLAAEFGGGAHEEAFDAGLDEARRVQREATGSLALLEATGSVTEFTDEGIVEWWAEVASPESKRAVVHAVVSRVTVLSRKAAAEADVDRIAVEWRR